MAFLTTVQCNNFVMSFKLSYFKPFKVTATIILKCLLLNIKQKTFLLTDMALPNSFG